MRVVRLALQAQLTRAGQAETQHLIVSQLQVVAVVAQELRALHKLETAALVVVRHFIQQHLGQEQLAKVKTVQLILEQLAVVVVVQLQAAHLRMAVRVQRAL